MALVIDGEVREKTRTDKPTLATIVENSCEDLLVPYRRLFDVVAADTTALREAAFRLRYQVYCIEHPFENGLDFPDGLERDCFDEHSVHSLLIHRNTQTVVGTVRLILPRMENRGRTLPIERVSRVPLPCPRGQTAEVSRFAISRAARNRIAVAEGSERQVMPYITLGLIQSLVAMSAYHGITHWCAVMEPTLLRLLGRLGIWFEALGPSVSYHGVRQPCYAQLSTLLDRVAEERPSVWRVITDRGRLTTDRFGLSPGPERIDVAKCLNGYRSSIRR